MVSRFFQLVLLAGMMLLIPSFLYLSHPTRTTLIDPHSGLAYSSDSILPGGAANADAQVSQGKGVDGSHLFGWHWQDASSNVNKGVHRVEDQVKGLIDSFRPPHDSTTAPIAKPEKASSDKASSTSAAAKAKDTARVPGVIMPKMANDTAKAALGRSTWHYLHTMTLRFPDKPTKEESETLRSFFHDFALLYPCGECARHFQQLIKELPPQVGSRMGASLWLCAVHNEVNKSLGKKEFPCDKLDESYDCGCGEDPKKDPKKESGDGKKDGKAATKVKSEAATVTPTSTHKTVTPFR
ncbi:ERV/ALR sulfhydryl oxidase domain protein [Kalmanozyma brasiliensis GHG001]|uniref:Sulfhydryl oxidase n=1 Tax=Kalmanozyma brasiliensis (strain GHG001) TaxID=1365824 RepID=V5GP71_KALBG|nr:ERV/ALR sulfhydryl oxidase domain protein [Kalmanozyma brasiliensis GHG001]EST07757.1 ERV/ALR sulfhydryl oxidase domain protein [Kalmanozyma brasiliensis GHG001]